MSKKRIFKTKTFNKIFNKLGLSDQDLIKAAQEIEVGLYEANLGGNLFKKRVAIGNRGKSQGLRTILATKISKHIFFIFVFSKTDKSNIDNNELLYLLKISEFLLNLSNEQLFSLMSQKYLFEVKYD